MVPFSFAGHELVPLPSGGLWWPARRALLVADLHLEKASWYAAMGQLLPPYDSAATLAQLSEDVARLGASELWCLGDSFHDAGGVARLPAEARAALVALAARVRIVWITGNHDSDSGAVLCGSGADEMLLDGLWLRHEARRADPAPEISGHYHPKLRVMARGRLVSRRCFVHAATKLILPAYGALTGGLDVSDPAILAVAGRDARALVPLQRRLLAFPIAA